MVMGYGIILLMVLCTLRVEAGTLFTDNFCGDSSDWTALSGTWERAGCTYEQTDETTAGAYAWIGDTVTPASWSDYTVTWKMTRGSSCSGRSGILVRSTGVTGTNKDGEQYFIAVGNSDIIAKKYDDGSAKSLFVQDISDDIDTTDQLITGNVTVEGSEITVGIAFESGEGYSFSVEDDSFSVGVLGLRTYRCTTVFESVKVTGVAPTLALTEVPSMAPTKKPTLSPTTTMAPTEIPSMAPTKKPTLPPTMTPTEVPSMAPTKKPTLSPTMAPTEVPSMAPTKMPTLSPSMSPTEVPSMAPTKKPTLLPTLSPTEVPSMAPTKKPTLSPTMAPTDVPSFSPTNKPTPSPTKAPTEVPSMAPTKKPTLSPTLSPTKVPSLSPTKVPSVAPTRKPTLSPTLAPTEVPSMAPTEKPTLSPSEGPSKAPTIIQTKAPTPSPTAAVTFVTEAPTSCFMSCPEDGYSAYRGNCYYASMGELVRFTLKDLTKLIRKRKITHYKCLQDFVSAEASCKSTGGNLISMHSETEMLTAFKYMKKTFPDDFDTPWWIGLYDEDAAPLDFAWTDGTVVNYTSHVRNVNDTSPVKNENCFAQKRKKWRLMDCTISTRYLCLGGEPYCVEESEMELDSLNWVNHQKSRFENWQYYSTGGSVLLIVLYVVHRQSHSRRVNYTPL